MHHFNLYRTSLCHFWHLSKHLHNVLHVQQDVCVVIKLSILINNQAWVQEAIMIYMRSDLDTAWPALLN